MACQHPPPDEPTEDLDTRYRVRPAVPEDAAAFFRELATADPRAFFAENRDRYATSVRGPLLELLAALPGDASAWRVYRPQQDVRFRPDRSPYKDFAGALLAREDGTGAFVRLDARGLLVASGMPQLARDQLVRFRAAVADDRRGPALEDAIATVRRSGGRVTPGRHAPLTASPRGYTRDHPRSELLRWKGVELPTRVPDPHRSTLSELVTVVVGAWERGAVVESWLATHVGPTALDPAEGYGRRRPARA